jgi:hypothetical protein
MNLQDVKQHIRDWVDHKLSVPSALFNHLPPCPYARPALLNNKVDIRCGDGAELVNTLAEIGRTWDDRYELILIVCEPDSIEADVLIPAMIKLNASLEASDFISFFDHPRAQDPKFKIKSGNEKYLVAGIQRLSYFVKAAKPLYKKDYFTQVLKQFPVEKHLGNLKSV